MKIIYRIRLIIFMMLLFHQGFSQVGIGTSEPSASALLDLNSTSKGLLVPRMTSDERSAIVTPSNGLLVFDLSSNTFWYYRGTEWHELISANIIDPYQIGGDTNYSTFEEDGTLEFVGDATVYNIFVATLYAAKTGGNAPDWQVFRNNGSGSVGMYIWAFDNNNASSEDELNLTIQMPHDYKSGSDIYPHVHWSPLTNGTGVVTWGIEYTWADYGTVFSVTTIDTSNSESFSNAQNTHMLTSLGTITPSTNQDDISSILCVRIFRNSSASADTYTGKVALLSFEIHYEANTVGSRSLYSK